MIEEFLIPWAMVAVTLFNTVLLLWMGLTVLLNARHRSWGNWLGGVGLLLGGLFFAVHTASLDYSIESLVESSPAWWLALSLPLLALPMGWLVLMLWCCGFWEDRQNALRAVAKWPLLLAGASFTFLVLLTVVSAPHGEKFPVVGPHWDFKFTFYGMRGLLVCYPPFLIICTATALYALANPVPTGRLMGEEARRRARPWLLASSLVQLVVSLGVAVGLMFIAYRSMDYAIYSMVGVFGQYVNLVDLILSAMVGLAVMLLGKAVVSYEIFTEKILPRRGFWRQWRSTVILAGSYSSLLALALVPPWPGLILKPVYPILLSTCLMSLFLAFSSHRAYAERERAVADLRPFVTSQHLYEVLISGEIERLSGAIDAPFHALCREVLGTEKACLLPRGHVLALAGGPKVYPADLSFQEQWNHFAAKQELSSFPCNALPSQSGFSWLVPLGTVHEPLGVLLLGEKCDGGIYTQEEIEVARAAGEHLLDAQAGATLATRLMNLQRHKLTEIQMLDRRARRVLHDDILPQLHTALLNLGSSEATEDSRKALAVAHRGISDLLREMPMDASPLARRGLVEALEYELKVHLSGAFDEIVWLKSEAAVQELEKLPSLTAETLFFAAREVLRNAARYGRNTASSTPLVLTLHLRCTDALELEIEDNGAGFQVPPSGNTELYRSGHGLDLHGTLLAVVGGQLALETTGAAGVRVLLRLPFSSHC